MNEERILSRRTALTAGTASLAALTGCSSLIGNESHNSSLDRILLRSDTGQTERIELILVYAPRDTSPERPVRGIYEAPASGDLNIIDDFDGEPGVYSLTATSGTTDNAEVIAFNSYSEGVQAGAVQFEVVIKGDGGMYLNVNKSGSSISIP